MPSSLRAALCKTIGTSEADEQVHVHLLKRLT